MFIIYRIIIRYIIIPVVLNFLNRLFYKIFSLLRIKFKRLDWTNYRDKNGDWISIRRKAETIFRMYRVEREKKKNEQRVSINDRSIFYPSKFHLETWTTMPAAINCAAFYRSSVFIFPLPTPPNILVSRNVNDSIQTSISSARGKKMARKIVDEYRKTIFIHLDFSLLNRSVLKIR